MTENSLDIGQLAAVPAGDAAADEVAAAPAVRRCPPRDEQPVLEMRDLSVAFDIGGERVPAIEGVDFSVYRGEIVAVVGESGSGKSVSSLAALRLLPATAHSSGEVIAAGVSMLSATDRQAERIRGDEVSMIFQEPMTAMNPVYTIGYQIAQGLRTHRRVSKAAARQQALRMLELVGMPDPERRIDQYPHQLSGGQRQRAMIAMALMCDPQVLIADEPTTALDVTVQADILDLLKDIQQRTEMAIVLITHDMGVVADIADRVIVMQRGRVVEEAFVDDIFADPQHPYTRRLLAAVPRLSVTEPDEPEVPEAGDGDPDRPGTAPGDRPALVVEDLVIQYPGRFGVSAVTAVDGVTFTIPRGQVLGLVGESGSGKSTVGRCVVGLLPPAAGRLEVCGHDLSRLSPRKLRPLRRQFGIVFQDPASSLNPRVSIGDSVAEPLRLHAHEMGRAAIQRRVGDLLESVELPRSWTDRYPHELSGGQRQRIGIARAIALEPELLVADEPTSALDVSVQAKVLEIFAELQRRLGFSSLFISHDLAVVESLADRIAVMREGTLVEQGSKRQILHRSSEPYTQRLIAAAPVPDPVEQRRRSAHRRELAAGSSP